MRKLVLWVVVAGLGVGMWAAVKFLPWWALVLALVGAVVVGRWVVVRRLRQLLTVPFKLKGAALRGATVEVHSAEPAEAPASSAGADSSTGPRRHVRLELTVKPQAGVEGPFSLWEPGELRLVKADSRFDPEDPLAEDGDEICSIQTIEIQHDGQFQPDEGWKLPGPQRLRLLVAVAPGIDRLKFRYYFEEFGQVPLPPGPAAAVA